MSLLDKLMKNSKIKETSLIGDSKVFGKKESVVTDVPMINVALSGTVDGGMTPGLLMLAGPSKHFKTAFSLVMAAAFQKKYKDGIILFYDSEFGSPDAYFKSFGVDMERVVHTPIMNVEELKFDLMSQLDGLSKGDHVMVLIDSVGNLASKKEVDDALEGSPKADMTRAKQFKSLWRMVTPHFAMKDIPCVAINHTYQTQEMYSKSVVSGGCMVAGSKVMLSDGTLKSIEDFEVGDEVMTLYGDKPVTDVWNPDTLLEGNPECYEVEFEDGTKYIVSAEHGFAVDGDWIDAQDLKGEEVITHIE